jgi:hypothetical protein
VTAKRGSSHAHAATRSTIPPGAASRGTWQVDGQVTEPRRCRWAFSDGLDAHQTTHPHTANVGPKLTSRGRQSGPCWCERSLRRVRSSTAAPHGSRPQSDAICNTESEGTLGGSLSCRRRAGVPLPHFELVERRVGGVNRQAAVPCPAMRARLAFAGNGRPNACTARRFVARSPGEGG